MTTEQRPSGREMADRPREWWLHNTDSNGDVYKWGFCSGTFDPDLAHSIHVIEFAAYEALEDELAHVIKKLNRVGKDRDKYKENAQEYSLKLLYTEQERDALKAKHEELLSYLPKVPTQAYEKEIAQENARLKAELAEVLRAHSEEFERTIKPYALGGDANLVPILRDKLATARAALEFCERKFTEVSFKYVEKDNPFSARECLNGQAQSAKEYWLPTVRKALEEIK